MNFRASRSSVAVWLLTVVWLLACGAPDSTEQAGEVVAVEGGVEAAVDPEVGAIEADLLEQLTAIGYLAGSEPAGSESGVVLHDAQRVSPGLNLLTSGHGPVAVLMDMQGEVLHQWRAEFEQVFPGHKGREAATDPHRNYWRDVLLFPNGDLLVIWELFGLFKLDRDSRVLWVVAEPVHHDLQLTPAGEVVHLQAKRRMIPGIPEKRAIDDLIVTRDANGKLLRQVAVSAALHNADWLGLRRAFWTRAQQRGYGLTKKGLYDPFHTNSLWLLSADEAARLDDSFRVGDALVSMAMLDTIAVIDLEAGVTRWWQQGPFGMQHQPHPTPEGEIVLFNNFRTPDSSSVVTLNPRTREITQEYTGPPEDPLYSKRSGRVEVLPNGNTLVVETDGGRALEVTRDGDVVWEFHSPYRAGDDESLVANLYTLERVGPDQTGWLSD